jgi:hypothetical protein
MCLDRQKLGSFILEGLVASRQGPLARLLGLWRDPTARERDIASGIADVVCGNAPAPLVDRLREAGVPVSPDYRMRELLGKDRMTTSEERELDRLTSGRDVIVLGDAQ